MNSQDYQNFSSVRNRKKFDYGGEIKMEILLVDATLDALIGAAVVLDRFHPEAFIRWRDKIYSQNDKQSEIRGVIIEDLNTLTQKECEEIEKSTDCGVWTLKSEEFCRRIVKEKKIDLKRDYACSFCELKGVTHLCGDGYTPKYTSLTQLIIEMGGPRKESQFLIYSFWELFSFKIKIPSLRTSDDEWFIKSLEKKINDAREREKLVLNIKRTLLPKSWKETKIKEFLWENPE
jgi:hypothetical protein